MQAYKAYYEGGRIVPLGEAVIPEGSELILTVLEPATNVRVQRQREAFEQFMEGISGAPPLPPEFDEIIGQRLNISRELDI